jgi:hypothetical protein
MDALYIYKHSDNNDFEIRHSLRSIARHAPYIRKVWIYGDRPSFISDRTALIEHAPYAMTSPLLDIKLPVSNFFLLMFLSSLIPDLCFEYLLFADDYFLLKDLTETDARKIRYLEDLSKIPARKPGLWSDSLWRTYDVLLSLGYPGLNFETHTPAYLTRKWVRNAFLALKGYVTEDKWNGLVGPSAVLNHAHKSENFDLTNLHEEGTRCGFWGKPPTFEEVTQQTQGKTFLNFDDEAFGEGIRRFLEQKFPEKSQYES